MTHARHVTPGRTAERLEKIRKLITALQAGQLPHDQIGDLLEMGPSGVGKYLVDLRGIVRLMVDRGEKVLRLAITQDAAREYLARLAPKAPVGARGALPSTASHSRTRAGTSTSWLTTSTLQ